jgi:hypothetical protein
VQWYSLIVKPKRFDLPQKAGGIFYFHFLSSLTICSSVSSEIDSSGGSTIQRGKLGVTDRRRSSACGGGWWIRNTIGIHSICPFKKYPCKRCLRP